MAEQKYFQEGFLACKQRTHKFSQNPYSKGTLAHNQWAAGWTNRNTMEVKPSVKSTMLVRAKNLFKGK